MAKQQAAGQSVLTVSQLTEVIKRRLESDSRLTNCYVTGEISNYKHHSSGHMYFTLKDEKSRIRAIMFSSRNRALQFVPEDGMRVVCRGTISVYERDGQYQIYLDDMQPDGVGALYIAFTQLKDRLAAEGLFDESRKRPLPRFPRRVGVITSPTGAVIRDICSTLTRRYPLAKVILYPSLVQGPGAAQTIADGVRLFNRWVGTEKAVDVLIVGRGGGSLEELWPFNEELVARAISASRIPVVSAVGHETDFTICDFVADVRAATPTAAAELVAPHQQEIHAYLQHLCDRESKVLQHRLESGRQRLSNLASSSVLQNPLRIVDAQRQNVDYFETQLQQLAVRPVRFALRRLTQTTERLHRVDVRARMNRARANLDLRAQTAREQVMKRLYQGNADLEKTIAMLDALSPLRVLSRGYSLVYRQQTSELVLSTDQVNDGDKVDIRLSDGTVSAVIQKEGMFGERAEQSRLDI